MILADKIVCLRKKYGWTQEELADRMKVSRQAVYKWESAQTVPDLEKILLLSTLFGVTTDYLLKDEIENIAFTGTDGEEATRQVSLEEAQNYLSLRRRVSVIFAAAVFLCILAVALFLVIGGLPAAASGGADPAAPVLGLIVLLGILAIAVALFLFCHFKNAPYAFLEEDKAFDLAYGVKGMVQEKQKAYRKSYRRLHIIAACLCVLSPIPLFLGALTEDETAVILFLSVTLAVAGIGVFLFLLAGVRMASMQKLLKEGEYAPEGKRKSRVRSRLGGIYWCVLTALFLAWSFLTDDWQITWIVFALGGVLFPAVMGLCDLWLNRPPKE